MPIPYSLAILFSGLVNAYMQVLLVSRQVPQMLHGSYSPVINYSTHTYHIPQRWMDSYSV